MDGVESSYGMKQNSPYTMIFSTSSSFSVNKTGVLEKSTDFATVHVSYGTSPDSGSLKEYDVICMNPDGFAIYCNITLSYGIFFFAGHVQRLRCVVCEVSWQYRLQCCL